MLQADELWLISNAHNGQCSGEFVPLSGRSYLSGTAQCALVNGEK
jgi:hypothetical protein